jgi:hypothetical protein
LGPFLQRRLSLAEQLGVWGSYGKSVVDTCSRLYPISVVETQCAKADTINWLKMANALFFLCCEMNSSHFFLIVGFPTETRHEFNSNNFIFTALNLLVRRLSFKTQFKIEFLGPFYGLKNP